jgi:hypothetical protein
LWHDCSPEEALLLSGPRFAAHLVRNKIVIGYEEMQSSGRSCVAKGS